MFRNKPFLLYTLMTLGYAFLYVPIASVVFYSFNASRMVTVWGGFSTQWYRALFENTQILHAAKLSLMVAVMAATLATMLGTMAGLALSRLGRFNGRGLMSLLTSSPLVMPDVMLGISALFLFMVLQQWTGWPHGRGIDTITIAHTTLCVCYVTVVIRSRLTQMDHSLEEAAMDLGAKPWKVFFLITLPLIWPALISGWLLAFTLSLDDLVIASFTSGPGSSTLPILIYSKVKFGVTPEINALATLIIIIVTVGVSVSGWLLHRQERRMAQRDN